MTMTMNENTPADRTRPPALVEIRLSDIAGYGSYDYENDEPTGEITIGDLVVKGLVDRIAPKLQADIAAMVREQVAAQVQAQVSEWVTDALSKPVQKFSHYGEPSGEAKPMPEFVAEQVKAWLTETGDRYDRSGKTRVAKMIEDEVDRALKTELSGTIQAAKAQVVKAVQTKAGELLGEAIRTANLLDGVRG